MSFTRARSKLIIIGSKKTLQTVTLLSEFFDLMDSRGWILPLPPNAHLLHPSLGDTPSISCSNKRIAEDMGEGSTIGQENTGIERPLKKAKMKIPIVDSGILRGRPIMKDLVNDDM